MDRKLVPTRLPERASTDRAALDALLDEVLVAHVGVALADGPLVVPTGFGRDGDRVLLHGSTGSRWLRALADGSPVCLTVTALDGLKVARSAFHSGMRYRSACLFGVCEPLAGPEAVTALEAFTDRLLPGRTAELRPSTARELAATMVLALAIAEWSLKVAGGFPDDPDEDRAGDTWAGVVPVVTGYGRPLPNPDLRPGIEVPASVRALGQ